jgi:hypothetical protein
VLVPLVAVVPLEDVVVETPPTRSRAGRRLVDPPVDRVGTDSITYRLVVRS